MEDVPIKTKKKKKAEKVESTLPTSENLDAEKLDNADNDAPFAEEGTIESPQLEQGEEKSKDEVVLLNTKGPDVFEEVLINDVIPPITQNIIEEAQPEIKEDAAFSSVSAGTAYKKGVVVAIILGAIGAIYLILQGAQEDSKTEETPAQQIQQRSQAQAEKLLQNANPAPVIEEVKVSQAPQLPETPSIKDPQPPAPPAPSAPQISQMPQAIVTNQPSPGIIQPPIEDSRSKVALPEIMPQSIATAPVNDNSSQKILSKEEAELKKKTLEARRKASIMVTGEGKAKDGEEKDAKNPPKSKDKSEYLGFGEGAFGESTLSKTTANQVKATHIGRLDSIIAEGKLIHAILETAINTDLPGALRAVITRDVYAESGKNVLIPKGSRVIGSYETQVKTGQTRVAVIWNRLIRPDGVDLALNSVGTDSLGRSGIGGFADDKFLTKLANAILISYVIPMTAEKIFSKPSQTDTPITTTTTTAPSTGVTSVSSTATLEQQKLKESQDKFNEVVGKALEDTFNTKTTIYVDQGSEVNIFVNRDLIFPSDGLINGLKVVR